jgi:hypothetical protein
MDEDAALAEIRAALQQPFVSLHLVTTFTHGRGVQVKIKTSKVGPILFPPEDGTVGDVLMMLAQMIDNNDGETYAC